MVIHDSCYRKNPAMGNMNACFKLCFYFLPTSSISSRDILKLETINLFFYASHRAFNVSTQLSQILPHLQNLISHYYSHNSLPFFSRILCPILFLLSTSFSVNPGLPCLQFLFDWVFPYSKFFSPLLCYFSHSDILTSSLIQLRNQLKCIFL